MVYFNQFIYTYIHVHTKNCVLLFTIIINTKILNLSNISICHIHINDILFINCTQVSSKYFISQMFKDMIKI